MAISATLSIVSREATPSAGAVTSVAHGQTFAMVQFNAGSRIMVI